ncbi:MAG: hypothetical protein RL653_1376 [Pseudomonadota bacterium]|jgi:hypothetical protein
MLQGALLATWAAWISALVGLGHWVLYRLRPRAGMAETFLAGLAASLVLATAVNLAGAVDGPVSAGAWALGAAGAWQRRHRLLRWARSRGALTWSAWALLGWVTAGAGLRPVSHPDAGLYYLSSIRLAESGAAVPGLALVNPYAALNQAFAPWSALLAVGPFDGRGWHVGGGLLAWVAACTGVGLLLRGRFVGLAAAPVVDAMAWRGLSSGSADEAVTAAGSLCAMVAFSARGQDGRGAFAARAAVAAGLLTLKQTLVLVLPLLLVEPLWQTLRARSVRGLALGAGAAVAAVTPWLGRSVVLSGMPLYPLGWLRLPVDWAAPASLARVIHGWAWVYARRPVGRYVSAEALGPWVADWFTRESTSNRMFLLPLALAGAGVMLGLVRARVQRPDGRAARLCVAAAVGVLGWWLLAPDTRFGQAPLWALGAVGLAVSLRGALRGAERRWVGVLALSVFLGSWVGEPLPALQPVRAFPALPDVGPRRTVRLGTGEEVPTGDCFEAFCHRTTDTACVAARTPGRLEGGFRVSGCNPLPPR